MDNTYEISENGKESNQLFDSMDEPLIVEGCFDSPDLNNESTSPYTGDIKMLDRETPIKVKIGQTNEDIPDSQHSLENSSIRTNEDISKSQKTDLTKIRLESSPNLELECTNSKPEDTPQLEDIPNSQLEDIPNSQLEDIPNSQLEDTPNSQLEEIPNSQLEDIPNSQLEDIPNSQLEDKPNSQLEDIPNSQLEDIARASIQDEDLSYGEHSLLPEPEHSLFSPMENGDTSSEDPIVIDDDSGTEFTNVDIKQEPGFDISLTSLEGDNTFGLDITVSNLEDPTVCMVQEPDDFTFQAPTQPISKSRKRYRKAPDPAYIPTCDDFEELLEPAVPQPVQVQPQWKPKGKKRYYSGKRKPTVKRKIDMNCPRMQPSVVQRQPAPKKRQREMSPEIDGISQEINDSDSEMPYDTVMTRIPTASDFPDSKLLDSPYMRKIDISDYTVTKTCDMKIMEAGVLRNNIYVPPIGTRLINIEVLSQVFSNFRCSVRFCKGRPQIYESTKKKGSQSFFVVFCSGCQQIVTKFSSSLLLDAPLDHCYAPQLSMGKRPEVNIRALLGIHTTSLTWAGFKKFCAVMDMQIPSPTINKVELEKLEGIVLREVDDSMRKASKSIAEREDAVPSVRPGCVEIAVSFDGSWKQRGHYSNVGFAAVIERKSRKVVDYELLNRICEPCSKWTMEMIESKREEYLAWWEVHKPKCRANFSGTSRAMESEAAVRIWKRSEDRGLVYSTFIGDGDGSGYSSVIKSGVYNGEVKVRKEECVGHLQKRLKSHLMKAKKSTKNHTFVNHQLEEHKADRVAHLFAVVVGQHVGKTAKEMSGSLWRMFDHISENHETCPPGENSYCFFQKRLAKHIQDPSILAPKQRKCYFNGQDIEKIKEEFRTFASEEVCEHLRLGATQNINESLHSVIWANCLKTKYKSPRCNAISIALSIICFNEGHAALAVVLKSLGMKMSPNSLKYLMRLDSTVVKNRERGNSPKHKATRRQRKIESKNREIKRRKEDKLASRGLYQSDKFGSEVKSDKAAKRSSRKTASPDDSSVNKKRRNKDACTLDGAAEQGDGCVGENPESSSPDRFGLRRPNSKKRARPQFSESETSDSDTDNSFSQDEKLETESLSRLENETGSGSESEGVCEECQDREPAGMGEGDWSWIGCEACERWFHDSCMDINLEEFKDKDYFCRYCKL